MLLPSAEEDEALPLSVEASRATSDVASLVPLVRFRFLVMMTLQVIVVNLWKRDRKFNLKTTKIQCNTLQMDSQ